MFQVRRFLLLAVLGVTACAHVVVEERLVPSTTEWERVVDTNNYNPKEISHILDMGKVELYVYLNHYQTSYRGSKVIGLEVSKEPNPKLDKGNVFVIKMGVRRRVNTQEYSFSPYNVSVELNGATSSMKYQPITVFKTERSVVCDFDYDGQAWGTNSEKMENKILNISKEKVDDKFECFNLVYELDNPKLDNISISFENTLLPLNKKKVYFNPKKIKWIRSN